MRRQRKLPHSKVTFEKLTLAALVRIKKKIKDNVEAIKNFEQQRQLHDVQVAARALEYEAEIAPLDARWGERGRVIAAVGARISESRLGPLDALFKRSSEIILWRGGKYDKSAMPLIRDYESLLDCQTKLAIEINALKVINQKQSHRSRLRPPDARIIIRDQLKSFTFDGDLIDLKRLEEVIALKYKEKSLQDDKREGQKAKAMAYDDKQRTQGKAVRKRIKDQLSLLPNCPYCEWPLAIENAHADHIYPLTHGGLSTSANMVFVCAACNQAKSASTLREFMDARGLDVGRIFGNLNGLGKRF